MPLLRRYWINGTMKRRSFLATILAVLFTPIFPRRKVGKYVYAPYMPLMVTKSLKNPLLIHNEKEFLEVFGKSTKKEK